VDTPALALKMTRAGAQRTPAQRTVFGVTGVPGLAARFLAEMELVSGIAASEHIPSEGVRSVQVPSKTTRAAQKSLAPWIAFGANGRSGQNAVEPVGAV